MEAYSSSSNGVEQAGPEDNDSIVDGLKDVTIQEGTAYNWILASGKRKDYLSWENYFMAVAKLAAMRSKDPNTQVGCAIVNRENKIIGTGYNGFPVGISDDDLPWGKSSSNPQENKFAYVVHAEVNAIINKSMNNIEGCTMYTTMMPCNECAKMIIQVCFLEYRVDIRMF
ncbi:unnamed protein product [Haemonchus placei]|uniref:dCMP deaminase n=1 Tax=Haemonchus placei TaxID=6290 RepID=A0A0N4W3G7_HAEPC|nr:unnamed protein product [Haemonchus placei]